jgi:hypothetical protein
MLMRRLEGREQIVLGQHVSDRISDQHGIEPLAESYVTHIAKPIIDLGIERTGKSEHIGTYINPGYVEITFQREVQVTTAAPQMKKCAEGASRVRPKPLYTLLSLTHVVFGWADDRPGPSQV